MDKDISLPFPGWTVVKRIRTDEFCNVYEAVRNVNESVVSKSAIKVIEIPSSENIFDEIRLFSESTYAIIERIVDEAKKEIAAFVRLRGHPNIVFIEDVADVIRQDQKNECLRHTLYVRQELLNPLPQEMDAEDVLKMGIDICQAIEAIETLSVDKQLFFSCDLTTDNILVSSVSGKDVYKLGNFGILEEIKTSDRNNLIYRNGFYNPPEVILEGKANSTINLYGLAMTMYVKLNDNCHPFLEDGYLLDVRRIQDIEQILMNGINSIPIPAMLSETQCKWHNVLSKTILKALAYKPEDRYQSASEMKQDLLLAAKML